MSRLVLIGLDGLEYTLVQQLKLKNLMLSNWSTYESSEELTTPYLWACIITGVPPEKALTVKSWTVPKNKLIRKLMRMKFLKFLRGKGLGRFVEQTWIDKEFLASTPIFDEYPSIVIDFPAYNWEKPKWMKTLVNVIGNKAESEYLLSKVIERDMWKARQTISALSKDEWRILAVWFQSTDLVTHLFPKNLQRHIHVYKQMDKIVGNFLEIAPNDSIFVVLSDHGNDWLRGVHKKLGFISCNRTEVEFPKKITEIYPWLKGLIES